MSKYGSHKTYYKGIRFDSRKEADRYVELCILQKAGIIFDLQRQVQFTLIPAQYEGKKCVFRATNYYADFTYIQDGRLVVEDVKGFKTKEYQLKKKMMYYFHHIKIKET